MPNLWLRLLILFLATIGGISWWIWGRRTKNLGAASFVFLWLLNLATFHVYRLICVIPDPVFLNNWSLGIHLQAVLSLAIVGCLAVKGKI